MTANYSMWVSKYQHLDLDGNAADTFRKGDPI